MERQLPVLGDAGAPTDLAQDVGADHVGGAGDHLHAAQRLLERPLDHVAARVLGPDRLGQPALVLVEDVPLVALHGGDVVLAVGSAVADLVEVRKQALDRIRERHGVGVEHHDVLGARVHRVHGDSQGAALEAGAVRPVDYLEARVAGPPLGHIGGAVGRVVDQDHLVVRILELLAGFEQAPDHSLLVVGGDLDRHERVVAKVEVAGIAFPGDRDATLAPLVSVPQQPGCGRGQHDDCGHVVAHRVAEEDAAREQGETRQDHADPVDDRMGLVDSGEGRGASHQGDEREDRDQDRDHQHEVGEHQAQHGAGLRDHLARPAALDDVLDLGGGVARGHPGEGADGIELAFGDQVGELAMADAEAAGGLLGGQQRLDAVPSRGREAFADRVEIEHVAAHRILLGVELARAHGASNRTGVDPQDAGELLLVDQPAFFNFPGGYMALIVQTLPLIRFARFRERARVTRWG